MRRRCKRNSAQDRSEQIIPLMSLRPHDEHDLLSFVRISVASDVMLKSKTDELPLEIETVKMYLDQDGLQYVVRRRRGFLQEYDFRRKTKARTNGPSKPNGRVAMTALADQLREHLDSVGLPTDKYPVMPIEHDFGYDPEDHGVVQDDDVWIDVVEDSTESLTRDQITANCLHAVDRLLAALPDSQLDDAYRAMEQYHLFCMLDELHALALDGAKSKQTRSQGPAARRAQAIKDQDLILKIAQQFWGLHPQHDSKPVITANKIIDLVNAARTAIKSKCKALSAKTIADHLRRAMNRSS